MKVLVSDTSVLIDLERGEFLESIFRLPFSLVVPDLLYERELKDYTGPDLIRYGLHVQELDSVGLALAIDYYGSTKRFFLFLTYLHLFSPKQIHGYY